MSQIVSRGASQLSDFRSSGIFSKQVTRTLSENFGSNMTGNLFNVSSAFFSISNKDFSFIDNTKFRLVCDVTSTLTTSTFANGSAQSLIDSLEIHGNNSLLERIENYNVYIAHVEDHHSSAVVNAENILSGKSAPSSSSIPTKQGRPLNQTVRIVIDVHCCLGSMSSQYVPCMNTNYRIKINFASVVNALVDTSQASGVPINPNTAGYKLTNMYLSIVYLSTTQVIYNQLLAESGGIFKVHSHGVQTHVSTNSLAITKISQIVPVRSQSLTGLLVCFRDPSTVDSLPDNIGSRIRPDISSFQFNVNGSPHDLEIGTNDGTNITPLSGEAFQSVIDYYHENALMEIKYDRIQYMAQDKGVSGAFSIAANVGESGYSGSQLTGIEVSGNIFLNLTLIAQTGKTSLTTVFATYERLLLVSADGSTVMSE